MGPLLSAGLHPAHNNEHEDKPGPRPAGPTLGIAAVIGVPAGVAAGRWAWSSFASSVGAVPVSVVPVAALSIGFLALLAAGTAAGGGSRPDAPRNCAARPVGDPDNAAAASGAPPRFGGSPSSAAAWRP